MIIGKDNKNKQIEIRSSNIKKHVAILGASGSGKTYAGKKIIEEVDVPSIVIDLQGDMSSFILPSALKKEVRVYTPCSNKGIPVTLPNPLRNLNPKDTISVVTTSGSITKLLGYNLMARDGKAAQNFLFFVLSRIKGVKLRDLSDVIDDPEKYKIYKTEKLMTDKERTELSRRLYTLSVGSDAIIFKSTNTLKIEKLMTENRINVFHMESLFDERLKEYFLTQLFNEIYKYIKRHPSENLQLILYVDEVAQYIPPHPKNPPAKNIIKQLFKEGRKFGLGCILSTQNVMDIDYKILGQSSTFLIGRYLANQDIQKMSLLLKSINIPVQKVRKLKVGEFAMVSPDLRRSNTIIKINPIKSIHKVITDDEISKNTPKVWKKIKAKAIKNKIFCEKCGYMNSTEDFFCEKCGVIL